MANLVTLAEVKTYLQIGFATDDSLLNDLIVGFSAAVEAYCYRSIGGVIAHTDILDGGYIEFALKRRPVVSLTAIVDLAARVSQELIGTGNGAATSFAFALAGAPLRPGVPGSVQIVAFPGAIVALDDGAGNLTGTGIAAASVVNYATGVGLINFSAPVAPGAAVKAAYTPIAAIVDPSLYDLDTGAGLVMAGTPATNAIVGVIDLSVFGRSSQGDQLWGFGRRRWQLEYQHGYATVPADVKQAVKIMIAGRYNRRDDLGSETVGDYSYKAETGDVSGWTPQVEQLLANYSEDIIG